MYRGSSVSVVVPAFNEELLIEKTLASIPGYVDRVFAIDDGSQDRTGERITRYARKDSRIEAIFHEQNEGVGAAIITGYSRSATEGIDIAVVMAGDNQMDPRYLPRLLDPIVNDEADYTKGNRLTNAHYREGMCRWRILGNVLLSFLTKIASGYWHITDPQNGFTAISKRVLEGNTFDEIYCRYGYCNHLLVWLNVHGFRVMDVMIPARYGDEKSTIRYHTYIPRVSYLLLWFFFWRIKDKYIINSFHPLVLLYLAGLVFIPLGILGGLVYFIRFVTAGDPIFERGVVSLILCISGVQFVVFAMFFDKQENQMEKRGRR